MRRDPLIIGAGPAGTAAAITLGRAGCQPVLIERSAGPTDKVCGDFLSADTIEQVRTLGVDPASLGAASIHRVRLIHNERVVETDLPFPALGLFQPSAPLVLGPQLQGPRGAGSLAGDRWGGLLHPLPLFYRAGGEF